MRRAIVIPARMGSTRFPGKPLVDLAGKPMVRWVWETAVAAGVADRVVIATPDDEILAAAAGFGAEALRTRADHPSGTDRIAELLDVLACDVVVNVQGDEPLLPVATVRAAAEALGPDDPAEMASVWCPCREDEVDDPNVVKVVTDLAGYALYFSRWALPYPRAGRDGPPNKHLGVYAYRTSLLRRYLDWTPTPLERGESLEQLRFLENGAKIRMVRGEPSPVSVDTPEQGTLATRELARRSLR